MPSYYAAIVDEFHPITQQNVADQLPKVLEASESNQRSPRTSKASRRAVYRSIKNRKGTAFAAEIESDTGFHRSTVLKCTSDLFEEGFIAVDILAGTENKRRPTYVFSTIPGVEMEEENSDEDTTLPPLPIPLELNASDVENLEPASSSPLNLNVESNLEEPKLAVRNYIYAHEAQGATSSEMMQALNYSMNVIQNELRKLGQDKEITHIQNPYKSLKEYIHFPSTVTEAEMLSAVKTHQEKYDPLLHTETPQPNRADSSSDPKPHLSNLVEMNSTSSQNQQPEAAKFDPNSQAPSQEMQELLEEFPILAKVPYPASSWSEEAKEKWVILIERFTKHKDKGK